MPRLTFTDYTSTSPRGIDSIPTFSFSANHNINIGQLNHFKKLTQNDEKLENRLRSRLFDVISQQNNDQLYHRAKVF